MTKKEELELLVLTKKIQNKLNHKHASIYQIIKYALEDLEFKVNELKGE